MSRTFALPTRARRQNDGKFQLTARSAPPHVGEPAAAEKARGRTEYRLPSTVISQPSQPHLKDGAIYRPLRPTRLDKIKNLSDQVRAGALASG